MQLQVMPPSLNAKLNPSSKACADWKTTFATAVGKLSIEDQKSQFLTRLTDLTFLETKKLVRELKGLHEAEEINTTMDDAWRSCTLEKSNDTGIRGKEEGAATPNRLVAQESGTADSTQHLEKTTQPTWRMTCEA
jgi:hypothetical protein